MNCLNCGYELPEGAKFCMRCGQRIPRCPTCGTLLLKRAKFCMMDGTRIPEEILALIPQEVPPAAPAAPEATPAPVEEPREETESVPEQDMPAGKAPVWEETGLMAIPAPIPEENEPEPVHQPTPDPVVPIPSPQQPRATAAKKAPPRIIPIIAAAAAVLILVAGLFAGIALFRPDQEDSNLPGENSALASEPSLTETDLLQESGEPRETQAPQIQMPNCVGWHYEDIVQTFEQLPGQVSFTYVYSDTVAENYILEQNVAEGSALTGESKILFVVSKGPDVAPEGYNQKVTVTAPPESSYGTLTLYDWENGQWVAKFSCNAIVGIYGISPDYGEGRKRTPEGVFKLGVALTAQNLPDVDWPIHLVNADTCVIDDVDSPDYNTIHQAQEVPYGVSRDPIGYRLTKGTSNICIYIEHNGNGYDTENVVPGKGSVLTVCGRTSDIDPTPGCVDITASNMEILISMLSYEKNTHIELYTE